MSKIKPRKIIIDFLYVCPSCGGEHYTSYDEVKKIGKIVCDLCRKLLILEPITKVVVDFEGGPTFSSSSSRRKAKGEKGETPSSLGEMESKEGQGEYEDLVDMLIDLGWRAPQARKAVDNGIAMGLNIGDPENFLTGILQGST